MFNETHQYSNDGPMLAFVKSTNIQAYPCGRRSAAINNGNTFIPFDPESRLTTEANLRKNSSLNGFTQTYVKTETWNNTNDLLSLVLAGYIFDIKLEDIELESGLEFDCNTCAGFAGALCQMLSSDNDISRIYANIFLEEAKLYQDTEDPNLTYATLVLRNQSKSSTGAEAWGETSIDLPISTNTDYYFSGLSFSTVPLTDTEAHLTRDIVSEDATVSGESRKRYWVSLCILEKTAGSWGIHQPALLPKIEHGDSIDSIKLFGDVKVAEKLTIDGETGNIKTDGAIEAKDITVTAGGLEFKGGNYSNITGVNNITAAGNINTASISTNELKYDGEPLHKLVTVEETVAGGNKLYQLKFINTSNTSES